MITGCDCEWVRICLFIHMYIISVQKSPEISIYDQEQACFNVFQLNRTGNQNTLIFITFMKIELSILFVLLTVTNCSIYAILEKQPAKPTEAILHELPSYPSQYHQQIQLCQYHYPAQEKQAQHPAMPFVRFGSEYVQCKLAQEKELEEGKLMKASERFAGGIYLWLLFCYEDVSCQVEAFLGPLMSDTPTIDIETLKCLKNTACLEVKEICEEEEQQAKKTLEQNVEQLEKKNLRQEIQVPSDKGQSLPDPICEIYENQKAELGFAVKWYDDNE